MHPLTEDDVAYGPVIPELGQTIALEHIGGGTVQLVDASVPLSVRCAAARVAYAAQRSTPSYKTGYDGTVTEDDQRLYVLSMNGRAVGLVLTAFQPRVWKVMWTHPGKVSRDGEVPLLGKATVIARVWVAEKSRTRGLGRNLVALAIRHLNIEVSNVGWEFPFTDSGSALVRRFCPSRFLASCDRRTLLLNTMPGTP